MKSRNEIADELRALGIAATWRSAEGCKQLPDGSYGPIVTAWTLHLKIVDPTSGHTAVRTFPEGTDIDPAAVASEMRAEMTIEAKKTRARIRAEKRRT